MSTKYYDKIADSYDKQWQEYTRRTLDKLIDYLPASLEGKKVLDWGCGTGELIKRILIRNPELEQVWGYDPSAEMLRQAGQKISQLPLQKQQQVKFSSDPPFDDKFDLLVSSSVFHYLPDPRQSLLKFRSLLGQQGVLVLLDYTKSSFFAQYFEWAIRLIDPVHQQAYQGQQIRKLVEAAGFKPLQAETFRVSAFWQAYVIKASVAG